MNTSEPAQQIIPFELATAVRPIGDGGFTAELASAWTIGAKPHGGYLLALLARAALVASTIGGSPAPDPLAVSADFLYPPEIGPVLIRTTNIKAGRTVTVLRVELEQRGRVCVQATVTTGKLPDDAPAWINLPDISAEPVPRAIELGTTEAAKVFRVAKACRVLLDPESAGFLSGNIPSPLRLRLWVRPKTGSPDSLFALFAGDISMPVTFNLGRLNWSPTVQLTALLRSRPSQGWLRIHVESRAVYGQWFDEDVTVIDSSGRLACQARQLALAPQN